MDAAEVIVRCLDPNHLHTLQLIEAPDPIPTPEQVVINVISAGVNRADLVQRAGLYPPPTGASPILGLEVAGTIHTPSSGPRSFIKGQGVCALLSGGGYSTKVAVHPDFVLPIPQGLTMHQASIVMEVFCTAWLNLKTLANLSEGQTVLIHGGAGGVGTAAIQIAKHLKATVVATCSGNEKSELCKSLGADLVFDRSTDWPQSAPKVDVVLDCVGASLLSTHQRLLRTDGTLVVIGLLGGRRAELDLGRLLVKRQRICGSTLRSLPHERKQRLVKEVYQNLWPLFERGEMLPVVDRGFIFEDIERAHEHLKNNRTKGKVYLKIQMPFE